MITWRKLTPADFPMLAHWLAAPHVHRWWHHEFTPEAVERDFGPTYRGEDPCEDLVVHLDHTPVGLLQRSRIADYPEELAELSTAVPVPPDTMTIDYFIADPTLTGKGLGTQIIRTAVESTWQDHPTTPAIIVPVVAANPASWRALEKAGATRIATANLRPDNPIDDPEHHIYRFDRPA